MPFLIPEHTDSPTPKCNHDLPPAITPDMIEGQPVPPVIPESRVADAQDLKQLASELKLAIGRIQHTLYNAYSTIDTLERKVANLQLLALFLGFLACGFFAWAMTASN